LVVLEDNALIGNARRSLVEDETMAKKKAAKKAAPKKAAGKKAAPKKKK
jgi:hypothetical protein